MFITITMQEGEATIKHLLRLDRIHCISEVTVGSEKQILVHYGTPDGAKTEVFAIEEDLHDIRRQMLHSSLNISDIGCGVPDTLPINFEKLKHQGILRTTGIEASPQFTAKPL